MSEQRVRREREDRDENGRGRPEVDAQSIEILAPSEAGQLSIPQRRYLLLEVLLPHVELDDSDPGQKFAHHLKSHRYNC